MQTQKFNFRYENRVMILFYSTYCPHCRMLLDTIERSDKTGMVKLVCVEVLRAKGERVPAQVQSVPALLTLPERRLLTGKAVFDYLLLPGTGKLLIPINQAADDAAKGNGNAVNSSVPNEAPSIGADPTAFSVGGFSDSFTDINHEGSSSIVDTASPDRTYQWTLIADQEQIPMSIANTSPEETRMKKQTIDLDAYKMQRDMDLQQSDLNTTLFVPPSFTR